MTSSVRALRAVSKQASTTMVGRPTAVWLGLILMLAWPASGRAQGVEGVVRHQATGDPLPGVLVSAFDLDGQRVRAELTNAQGGFSLDLPLGQYDLRAERIGLSPATLEGLIVRTFASTFHAIEMVDRPVEIAGLVVDSRVRSCSTDPRQAVQIQRWWSDVRTALDVNSALQSEQFGQFLIERFDRAWDADLETVLAQDSRWELSSFTTPFTSAPAEQLMREGFVLGPYGPSRVYHGPDADVLLSSTFLAAHCFTLAEQSDRQGQVGLRFEPAEIERLVDIAGTLWVDTATAQLTDLEFEYVNIGGAEEGNAGGRVVFDYLPSGAWIVSDWYIRIPKTGLRGRRNQLSVIGYSDGGGTVTPIPEPPQSGSTGSLRGFVMDRLRGASLSGALVTLLGTEYRASSDSEGQFAFADVPAGRYFIVFEHEGLTRWDVSSAHIEVDVPAADTAEVLLSTPTFEDIALAKCLEQGRDAETVILGRTLSSDGVPLSGVGLQLQYEVRNRAGASLVHVSITSDHDGRFAVCTVPGGVEATVRVRRGRSWEELTVILPRAREVTYREIRFAG